MGKFTLMIAALVMSGGVALAQTSAAPAGQRSDVTKVEHWTTRQWHDAKTKWAKDETKWADCRRQSAHEKLSGRKSWSFLYTCMNT